ncbi:MAG TPA: hypothetical protein GX726_05420 [Clostridiales bacterium]|jgi:hypothetical protein|nr:hypothetical protein [Clostridiales bacterium]
MKQMIVMIAMIALGVAIAAIVMGFSSTANSLATDAKTNLTYNNIMNP